MYEPVVQVEVREENVIRMDGDAVYENVHNVNRSLQVSGGLNARREHAADRNDVAKVLQSSVEIIAL